MADLILEYLKEIEKEASRGVATEHTYRPALKKLVEGFDKGIAAVNEPKRTACGAPDYLISRRNLTLGYIEAKDIGVSLNETAKSEQLKRYFQALENLILTDYLEFRWYVNGEMRQSARAGNLVGNKVRIDQAGAAEVETMLREFIKHKPQTIRRPKELATRMANLAHMVRDIIVKAFEQNNASDMLKDWRSAFAQTLMHDLERPERTGDFADMFAQTIAYGLFSARVLDPTPENFSRQEAQALIPKSNPFLRNFFYQITGPALDDELFAPFVDDLVAVLAHTDMPKVLKDFGASKKTRDPVFHFYETFLAEYDPALREKRGVYYTPDPVVSYIVRSVDHILKSKFKCPDGLADASKVKIPNFRPEKRTKKDSMCKTDECHRVLILDPACGTGTFLYEIIGMIREQFMERNDAGMWPGYVKNSLLPRLFGFELMMAPYAIAHFKLSLQLAGRDLLELQEPGWKYEMEEGNRLNIFLTNTLEDMHEMSGLPLFARWIAEETEAANEVKRDLPIMVICGNPPYSGHSENNGPWISDLINDYKFVNGEPLGERNSKWLQDDYVKFIRFAQWRIDQSGSGVLAFISNNGYLDNPTFRGMRWSLMQSFNDIYILNLHGSSKKKETAPDGSADENVFDIQQGVCIGIFVKQPDSNRKCQVHYADLWGGREQKYAALERLDVKKTKWEKVQPGKPFHLFIPQDGDLRTEYERGWKITDAMPVNGLGVVTARDDFAMALDKSTIGQRLNDLRDSKLDDAKIRARYGLKDNRDWKLTTARQMARDNNSLSELTIKCTYRPFDDRWCLFGPVTMDFPRQELMNHMRSGNNLGLSTTRSVETGGFQHIFCTRNILGHHSVSLKEVNYLFPLYLEPEQFAPKGKSGLSKLTTMMLFEPPAEYMVRRPNFASDFLKEIEKKVGKQTPEKIFNYIYAILHSPVYRTRYADFLKIDFPRVPLTSDKKLFAALVKLGGELSALHLMESPELNKTSVAFPVAGNSEVEKGFPKFNVDATPSSRSTHEGKRDEGVASTLGRVYINKTQYFDGVPSNVWNFTIGGYQVCEKWLKDRRERQLTHDDLQHYKKTVAALSRTIELMQTIDATIPAWPIQ
jgi:predicted helicase